MHHDWRESFAGFIQQQHTWITHQRAADGEHLLFAAGELPAHAIFEWFEQRQHVVDTANVPKIRAVISVFRGDDEIVFDSMLGKNLPVFRDEANACARDQMRSAALDRLALQIYFPGAQRQQSGDGFHRRALTRTVSTEQR